MLEGKAAMARVFWRGAVRFGRALAGLPDYDAYVRHLRTHHPQRSVPTYAQFFAERQRARHAGRGGRCC